MNGASNRLILQQPSWLTSRLVHLVILLVLGLLVVPGVPRPRSLTLTLGEQEEVEDVGLGTLTLEPADRVEAEPEESPPTEHEALALGATAASTAT